LVSERDEYELALKNIRGSAGGIEGRDFRQADPIAAANFLKSQTKGAMDATIEQQTGERVALAEAVYNDIIANSRNGWERGIKTFSIGSQANFAWMTGREDAFM